MTGWTTASRCARAVYGAGTPQQHSAVLDLVPEGAVIDDRLLETVLDRTRPLGAAADLETFQRNLEVIRHQTALFHDSSPPRSVPICPSFTRNPACVMAASPVLTGGASLPDGGPRPPCVPTTIR